MLFVFLYGVFVRIFASDTSVNLFVIIIAESSLLKRLHKEFCILLMGGEIVYCILGDFPLGIREDWKSIVSNEFSTFGGV